METVESCVESEKIVENIKSDEQYEIIHESKQHFDDCNVNEERIFNFESTKQDEYSSDDDFERERYENLIKIDNPILFSFSLLPTHTAANWTRSENWKKNTKLCYHLSWP